VYFLHVVVLEPHIIPFGVEDLWEQQHFVFMYGFVKHPFILLDLTPNITSFHLLTPTPNSLDQILVLSRIHKKVKMGLSKLSPQQL
jgi:hypothetical protein